MDLTGNLRHSLKAPWPISGRRLLIAMRLNHCFVLFGVLTAVGALAFLFSVVSPYDDDVQQEFAQVNRPKHSYLENCKKAAGTHALATNTGQPALLSQRLVMVHCGVKPHDLVADQKIIRTISSSGTGDRSPPNKSS
jgi:hypothetical protein